MADFDGSESLEERTEDATQSRRDEWKREGNVTQSRELSSALLLISTTIAIYMSSQWSLKGVYLLFSDTLSEINKLALNEWSPSTIMSVANHIARSFAYILAPIVGVAFVVGVVTSIAQTGFVWTTRPLEPDLTRLSPMAGVKRIFSAEGVFEMAKAILKFAIVGFVVFFFLNKWVHEASDLWNLEAAGLSLYLGRHVLDILLIVGSCMLVMALVDFGFQKFRFEQKIKMTKQEAKEERKQNDGNPQIKARIRGVQRQMANRRMMDAVKKADVIVTNPTHIAVAIMYDRENMFAPKIVAKGADFMAERIKKIARENGVPCVENVPLARAMFKALKIGQFISRDLYNAVAEVLAYVYRLKGRNL